MGSGHSASKLDCPCVWFIWFPVRLLYFPPALYPLLLLDGLCIDCWKRRQFISSPIQSRIAIEWRGSFCVRVHSIFQTFPCLHFIVSWYFVIVVVTSRNSPVCGWNFTCCISSFSSPNICNCTVFSNGLSCLHVLYIPTPPNHLYVNLPTAFFTLLVLTLLFFTHFKSLSYFSSTLYLFHKQTAL